MSRPARLMMLAALAALPSFRAMAEDTPKPPPPPATRPGAGRVPGGVVAPRVAQRIYEQVKPSLVAVQYTYAGELGRSDVVGAGVVVGEDGLVMVSMAIVPTQFPNSQLVDFKVIVPGDEEVELDAIFCGRDERSSVAFVRTKQPQRWKALTFVDVPLEIGQGLLSVGLLPKSAGYHAYLTQATVSANLRGPVPQTLVSADGLGIIGSPVLTPDGRAIGFVNSLQDQQVLLNDPRTPLGAATNPPRLYVPARDFLQSISDPPKPGTPLRLPWMGISQIVGLTKDVAEIFHLKGVPAVQVGAVIPGFAAEAAGIQAGDIITKLNGQPLERGDEPDEAAMILTRQVRRLPVGSEIKLTVIHTSEPDAPPREVTMKLGERPKPAQEAARFYDEELGFTTRELVFEDRYDRRLPADAKGVVVALVKPSSSAQSARLSQNDLVTQINRQPVTDLDQFRKLYQDFRKEHKREAVVLEVLRGVNTEVVRIEPPQ